MKTCDCYIPRRDWCYQLDFPEGCYYAKSKTGETPQKEASKVGAFATPETLKTIESTFDRTFGKCSEKQSETYSKEPR